jgi:uncharacterized protein
MIQRLANETLLRLAGDNTIVIITGPRKSGKTALARATFPNKPYVSLDSHTSYESARKNPEKFLADYPDGAIIDDAHRCPELITYLRDNIRPESGKGLFVVISPIYFEIFDGFVADSGGKVAVLRLLPFSFTELVSLRGRPSLSELILLGSYPPVCQKQADPETWFSEYIMNLIERDLRHVVNVRNMGAFSSFFRSCAAHSGYLVNHSELAYECGITHNTAKAWIGALKANHIIFQLYPHTQTFGRRTVKSPKLYFYDSGFAAFLLGIRDPAKMMTHPSWPFLFENFIISELLKTRFNAGLASNLYYWCDSVGNEISVVVERGEALIPIRIKSSYFVPEKDAAFLAKWRKLNKQSSLPAGIIYCGQEQMILNGFTVYPWNEIGEFGPRFSGAHKAYMRK